MSTKISFTELGLSEPLLLSLSELGYESPTAIQARSIPVLIDGNDLLAQAQTGTGKTAAFALPILSHIDASIKSPQALVIVPTRELAIQVAEAFQRYARHINNLHVTAIYGGQSYDVQLRAIQRGTQVIVGTPGRLMDLLKRNKISFTELKHVVLDEADEMLKMGFIDDVETILKKIPEGHQTSLFSATMPSSIQKVAKRYLKDAEKIHIEPAESTVSSIEQFYTKVSRNQKLDVLTRFLEIEDIKAAIIFTRTKNCSDELAEKLQARGYAAAALNGDLSQALRKKVIDRIKSGKLDLVIATDVAARGIDVERVTHVINYDIPHDTESYIHRIGRTGRAGRAGKALLFVSPREQYMLKDIERAVNQKIPLLEPPSVKEMKEKRSEQLAEKITETLNGNHSLKPYREMINSITENGELSATDVAAALAFLLQESNPLASHDIPEPEFERGGGGRDRSRKNFSGGKHRPSGNRNRSGGGNRTGGGNRSSGGDRGNRSSGGERSERGGRSDGNRSTFGGDRDRSGNRDRSESRSGAGSRDRSGSGDRSRKRSTSPGVDKPRRRVLSRKSD